MIKLILTGLVAVAIAMSLTSCTPQKKMAQQYPEMYNEKPLTIALMPPINQTSNVEAKESFYSTLYAPLCENGYYIFPPFLTMEMMQEEGAYDAEQFLDADLTAFRNVMGADAVLFTVIKQWKKNVFFGCMDLDIEFILRSTKTGETIFYREGDVSVNTQMGVPLPGLAGIVGTMVASSINTTAKEIVYAGRKCTRYMLNVGCMPMGKYNTYWYDVDKDLYAERPIYIGEIK
ncbi:MAG: DUF799 family lipoprotein [Bacteroidales bacterium]|nr:DUF799 family lipoprotein [Bacteroidales bacterium]